MVIEENRDVPQDTLKESRTMKLRHLASDDRKLDPSRIRCA